MRRLSLHNNKEVVLVVKLVPSGWRYIGPMSGPISAAKVGPCDRGIRDISKLDQIGPKTDKILDF